MLSDPREALQHLRIADQRWRDALESSDMAPPDPGFPARVLKIADASEQEAAALRIAEASGLSWRPAPGARGMRLSYELRPGGNRPGPPELWESFDQAVQTLGDAMEGVAISAVSRAFAQLSEVAREIAVELEHIYVPVGRRRAG